MSIYTSETMKISCQLVLFLTFFGTLYHEIDCFFEVFLTDSTIGIPNDEKYVNLDKLRVKKYNKSGHYVLGEMETFVEFNNDFTVCF